MDIPLRLERYAQLRAEVDERANLKQMLRRDGIGYDVWLQSRSFWDERLALEARDGKATLRTRYEGAYNARRRMLGARNTPPELPRVIIEGRTREPVPALPMQQLATTLVATAMPQGPAPTLGAPSPRASHGATPRRRGLTMEQLASFAAEALVHGAQLAEVRLRYGLDVDSQQTEFGRWSEVFARDASLYARYVALVQSYRDWLLAWK